jgi:hypothetical protein
MLVAVNVSVMLVAANVSVMLGAVSSICSCDAGCCFCSCDAVPVIVIVCVCFVDGVGHVFVLFPYVIGGDGFFCLCFLSVVVVYVFGWLVRCLVEVLFLKVGT